jgi:hypothetical protein
MAFLKCVSTYGAEGHPGQYLERNLLCDKIADVNGLIAGGSLVKSNLNGVCPSVCVGDVFNVFVKRDNDTFRSADNKFRPELIENWEITNMRLTCVYVERDGYSDKLLYALFIPHAKSKIIQPLVIKGDETRKLPYNNSLFASVYVVNIGETTGGGDTVSVNNVDFDFKNKEKFKYILCSVTQSGDKSLEVSKSNNNAVLLFCAVVDTGLSDASSACSVVTHVINGDISQADEFFTILPYDISPSGVLVELYPYDENKLFNAKPVFKLTLTNNEKTVICDNILANKFKPINIATDGHKIAFGIKTVYEESIIATVRVFLYT